jgi:hypothetical protein
MLVHHLTVTPTNLSQKPLFIQGLLHFSYINFIEMIFFSRTALQKQCSTEKNIKRGLVNRNLDHVPFVAVALS